MLPVEDPPDPFSIRDYVFKTRHSHLHNNWPFSLPPSSSTHTHGHSLNDLLPPFQPPPSSVTPHSTNQSPLATSMASKLCPVCKTFSSSSNTTLNAHIDQCLAAVPTHLHSSSSTKPTKRRSMLDIYATAPRCTLQDASNNPVYVDSNGIKLRIISKSMPIHPQPKSKYQIPMSSTLGIKHGMNNGHDKEESASQPFKSRSQLNCGNLETLTQWVSSKRTSRSKRAKGHQFDLGLSSSTSSNASIERNERNCGDFSFGESCIMSSPSENARYAKSPLYESQLDSHNTHENNPFTRNRTSSQRGGSLFTFPKPLGAFATSPSDEGAQLDGGTIDNSDIFLKKSVPSTEFAVESSIAKLVAKLNRQKSALRKPRMRRCTKMDGQLSTKVVNFDSAENSPEMGETCNFERWSDKRKPAFVGVEVLNIQVDTKDASQGRQRRDLDVSAAMKSPPSGISSSDCQWRSFRVDPAAPGSNTILLTQDINMVVDGDSSSSPISAVSTLSHPTVQRCNSQLSETESFVNPCEDPGGPIMNTWSSERHSFSEESCEGATVVSHSEESVKFKGDQPCSCFMRWTSSFDASPSNQDPQVLKQGSTKAKMAYTSTSIGSLPPVSRMSDIEHSSPHVLHNREAQDAQSVLRLMGKNLVVVNKDAQLSPDSCFADSSTKHPERAGVSSQDSRNPRQHMDPSLMCEAELSSRMKSYFNQPSPAGTSSFPFHPFPFPTIWGDTLRGGQVTFQNSFASYYYPTLP